MNSGIVQTISGTFTAYLNGRIIELKVGDKITSEMILSGTTLDSIMEVLLNDGVTIFIEGRDPQTIAQQKETLVSETTQEEEIDPNLLVEENTDNDNPEETAAGESNTQTSEDDNQDLDNFNNDSANVEAQLAEENFDDPVQNNDGDNNQQTLTNATLILSTSDVSEDDIGVIFTATLDQPALSNMIIETTQGSIIIPTGEISGSLSINTQDSDVYIDPDSITVTITEISGGGFTNLDILVDSATAQISDTTDNTNYTLTSSLSGDENDATVTYTVEFDTAPTSDETVTFYVDGVEKTITVDGTGTGSTTVEFSEEDVFVDTDTIPAPTGLTSTNNSNFEQLTAVNNATSHDVLDTTDNTNYTLTSSLSGDENDATVTYTVEFDTAPTSDETVTFYVDGVEKTITVDGTGTGSTTVEFSEEDVFVDTDTIPAPTGLTSTNNSNFEQLTAVNNATSHDVLDTTDNTNYTLTSSLSGDENDATVTYTVEFDTAPTSDETVTFYVDGVEKTITVDGTGTGSTTVEFSEEDVFVDTDTIPAPTGLTSTNNSNFEQLTAVNNATSHDVLDTTDNTNYTLTSSLSGDENDATVTYTVEFDTAPTSDETVTFYVDGVEKTITVDGTGTGSTTVEFSEEDVFVDTDTIPAPTGLTSTNNSNFEQLTAVNNATSHVVGDSIDTVTATLTVDVSEVSESGGTIIYTITLNGGPGDIDPDNDLIFTLNNGETITIEAGETSGSVEKTYIDSDITNQDNISNSIASYTGGEEYENLVTSGTTLIDIDYLANIIGLDGTDLVVDEDDLMNGSDTDKESTTQSNTFTLNAPDGISSLTIDGEDIISNGVFTATQITTVLGNTLDIQSFDSQTGEVTYTYTLNDNEVHTLSGEDSISESFEVNLIDIDGDSNQASLDIEIVDDIPTAGIVDIDQINQNQFTVTFLNETASFFNSYGYYLKDQDGNPTTGKIIWAALDKDNPPTDSVTITGYTPDEVGFFIIPNGGGKNQDLEDDTDVTFETNQWSGDWEVKIGDTVLQSNGYKVYFDNQALNGDGEDHLIDDPTIEGNQNWEDLPNLGDADFGDVSVDIQWSGYSLTLDESPLPDYGDGINTTTISLEEVFETSASFNYGADQSGSVTYSLSLSGSGEFNSGFRTLDGDNIVLSLVDGKIVGMFDNITYFDISVNDDAQVTFTRYENVQHTNTTNHDDLDGISLSSGQAIVLTQLVTDADGDSDSSEVNLVGENSIMSFSIEDDGPGIETRTRSIIDGTNSNDSDNNRLDNGYGSDDIFDGKDGDDHIYGRDGNDIIVGGSGNDFIDSGSDEDILVYSGNYDDYQITANNITDLREDSPDGSDTVYNVEKLQFADGYYDIESETFHANEYLTTNLQPNLEVDESNLNTIATTNFSDRFTITYDDGTDGQDSIVTTYELGTTSGDSGLVDTASGESIYLSLDSGIIYGKTQNTEHTVFTVSISSNADITLSQFRAVEHPSTTDYNESITLTDSLITLTRIDTITDKDGDTATSNAVLNIGANIVFKDDGPTVTADTTSKDEDTEVTDNVLDNDTAGEDGYLDPHLVSVTYAGTEYIFDENNTNFEISTNAGTIKIYDNGTYTFTSATNVSQDISDEIEYTISDEDGDTTSATLTLTTENVVQAPSLTMTFTDITDYDATDVETIDLTSYTNMYAYSGTYTVDFTSLGNFGAELSYNPGNGLGVKTSGEGNNNGAKEIDDNNEAVVIDFGKMIQSADISFKHIKSVNITMEGFDTNGNSLEIQTLSGYSNDASYTYPFELNNQEFKYMIITGIDASSDGKYGFNINGISTTSAAAIDEYKYELDITATKQDVNDTLSNVILSDIASGVTVTGNDLITSNGAYEVDVESGVKSTITITSSTPISGDEILGTVSATDLDGDSIFVIADTNLDNTITYNSSITIDGGVGDDILVVDDDIDFTSINAINVNNIETLDLLTNTDSQSIKLSLDDVLNMTDDDNILIINGDTNDSISLDTNGWSPDSEADVGTSTSYTYENNDSGTIVTLIIDDNIQNTGP